MNRSWKYMLESYMFAGLEKRSKSAAHFGLFATCNIPAGTIIVPKWHEEFYLGMEGWQFLTVDEILRLPPPKMSLFLRYGLDVGFYQIVGPCEECYVTTLDNFINHSCEPTLTYDHEGNVITTGPIQPDSELTIDYGCFAVNFDEEFDCECGSRTCRRRVRRDDWRKLASRYGYAMPRFLHEQIRAVLNSSAARPVSSCLVPARVPPLFDPETIRTPAYVCDLAVLEENLRTLARVQAEAGCKILLALKAFAMWSTFPLVRQYLAGAAASSLFEAQLAREHLGGELHVCAPAYLEAEFAELTAIADHIVFNSFTQLNRFRAAIKSSGRKIRCAIRINPEHSEAAVHLYDPCSPQSRLGVRVAQCPAELPAEMDGLHFHTLCESGADALERTLAAVESRFAPYLKNVLWVNFGGGHNITKEGYDVTRLIQVIRAFRQRWNVDVYLEPGEAVALNAGYLVASVLDVLDGDPPGAILDTSATAHMPDVLEMPYRPAVVGAGQPGEFAHTYRLGGLTCLAGDVIGEYSFAEPIVPGRKLVFLDMAHYTMVKNTWFNGLRLPSLVVLDKGACQVQRTFHYQDYRDRLS